MPPELTINIIYICLKRQVERLGDSRQTVRQQALHVLVCLFQTLRPEFVWDKLAQHWNHKNWKIKHGLLEVTAEAISVLGNMIVPAKDQSNPVLKQVIKLLEDQDS